MRPIRFVLMVGAALLAPAATGAACSSFSASSDGPDATADDADSGGDDDMAAPDAAADADGAEPNLLHDPGFDDGCGFWMAVNASAAGAPGRDDGGMACRFCQNGPGGATELDQEVSVAVAAGDAFLATIWVRANDVDADASPGTTALELHFGNEVHTTGGPVPTTTWTSASIGASASADAGTVTFAITFPPDNAGRCVDVDDAFLGRAH